MNEYQSAIAGFIAFPVVKWLLIAVWNQIETDIIKSFYSEDDEDETI